MSDEPMQILRQAREERGGSYVGIVAVVHNGELYQPPEFRLGPFPDGPSAGKAAQTLKIDEADVLARIEAGELRPVGAVADPEEEETVVQTPEQEESREDGPETGQPEAAPSPSSSPASSSGTWEERVKRAWAAHDRAESDFQLASRARDAAVLDAYDADDGASTYREIADWVGVTHQTVQAMAKRERERRLQAEMERSNGDGENDTDGNGTDSGDAGDGADGV